MDVVPGIARPLVKAPEGHFLISTPQFCQIPHRGEGHGTHRHSPLLPQLHHRHRLLVFGLREGVFQRRTAVTYGLPSYLLGTMDMAQSYIVEGLKDRHIHIVCTTHRDFL